MTDTPPEIENLVRNELMARSGEERFIMGAQRFEAALEMIKLGNTASFNTLASARAPLF